MSAVGNESYTRGCIDSTTGEIFDQEAIDAAYRLKDGHITRSEAFAIYEGGGPAQEMLESGLKLFSGNAGTDFGTIVDRSIPLLVTGGLLSDLFVVPPDEVLSNGARRGKPYQEWRASLEGRLEVSAADWWRLDRIFCNAGEHARFREILKETIDCQAAFRWVDEGGHYRKALLDGLTPGYGWDFKTTSSSWKNVWRSFMDYGYVWQSAWYSDAIKACGWPDSDLKFVIAQSHRPHAIRVRTVPRELVQRAREQIARTLDQIAWRRELGVYRAPDDEEEQELEFPAWVYGGSSDGD
jgi:hypothetical protein